MSLTKVTYSMIDGAILNVLDYGAVGDGVADDTTAIQAALDKAPNVEFPVGYDFIISSALTLNNGQNIFGYGATVTQTTAGASCFTGTSKSNLSIRGLTVNGYSSTYNATNTSALVNLTSCSDFELVDIKSSQSEFYGILLTDALRFTVSGCSIKNFGYAGIMMLPAAGQSGCIYGSIKNNLIDTCTRTDADSSYGIALGGASLSVNMSHSYINVESNTVLNVPRWNGLDVHGGQHIAFRNNTVRNCRRGIEAVIGYASSSVPHLDDIQIQNNEFVAVTAGVGAAPEYGIGIGGAYDSGSATTYNANRFVVTGNVVNGFNKQYTGGLVGGVYATNIDGLVLNDNYVYDSQNNAVVFLTQGAAGVVTNVVVNGNTLDASTSDLILFGTDGVYSDIQITGNMFKGSTTGLRFVAQTVAPTKTSVVANTFSGVSNPIGGTLSYFTKITDNAGLISRAAGITGSIASASMITTGLIGAAAYFSVTPLSGTANFYATCASNGNNFNVYASDGAAHVYAWEAAIAQDY